MDLSERGSATARHPWERARAAFFVDVLADHGLLAGAPRVLDVGAGDGFFAGALRARWPRAEVALWDAHYQAGDLDALGRAGFLASTARPAGPFDVVILLDVAEHVDDDRAFLKDALAAAAPDAHVLFSVPAWPLLWSSHDEALDHRRRYRPREARALLDDVGLSVIESGGVFHGLLLPRALEVVRERALGRRPVRAGVGGWRGGAALSSTITAALRAEQRLTRALSARGLDVPGLSFWALARRR